MINDLPAKESCTGCGVCEAVCPQKAITLKSDQEGFLYPSIDESHCSHCHLCVLKCPIKQITPAKKTNTYFCAHAKNPSIRLLGSSGGIFPLLALHVLQAGGLVFGAFLSEDGQVIHKGIRRIEDLEQITKTKYVQSNLSGIWKTIELSLMKGYTVLFCGTPCQTEGLRSYLGQEYENLFLLDLVCYGVASPGIWRRYINFLERNHGQKFRSFSFRDKRGHDNGHTVSIQLENTEYVYSIYKDPFLKSYFTNINIRPSCYHCHYCTVLRNSDITLGDFWGLEQVRPAWEDGMGNSLLICHTQKGGQLFDRIKQETEYFPCKEAEILQPRLQKPTKAATTRGFCMYLYRFLPFSLWIHLFTR